jgi:hypothetical protein
MYEFSNYIADHEYDSLYVKIFIETAKFDILSISLEKDAIFPNHGSPTDLQRIDLEGDIIFHMDAESYPSIKFQSFSFRNRTEHWVKTTSNSKFLIVQ